MLLFLLSLFMKCVYSILKHVYLGQTFIMNCSYHSLNMVLAVDNSYSKMKQIYVPFVSFRKCPYLHL